MERDIIQKWFSDRKIESGEEAEDKMLLLAEMIHEANQKFNITGFKTVSEIIAGLILKSIEPVWDIIVPRGTRFADIGSGAGIPGIPLAIYFKEMSGILVESNEKKASFIESAIDRLDLRGRLRAVCERAEELGRNPEYREKFDYCFARAAGKIFVTAELCSPFLKKDGFLYVYSNIAPGSLVEEIYSHIKKLGLMIMSHESEGQKVPGTGLFFKKSGITPGKYPRRFSVIKKESDKIEEQ